MLRRNPLTVLLLVATVVVDVVFITVRMPGGLDRRALFAGLLFGQMAAFAIWAARGRGNRLARISLLVVASCLIGLATGGSALLNPSQWLAILVGYTLSVYLATVLVSLARNYTARKSGNLDEEPTWQVSLIELFGWTILVAIASFVARSMDFEFVRLDNYILEKATLFLVLPLTLAVIIRNDLRDLPRGWLTISLLLLVTLVVAAATRLMLPSRTVPGFAVLTQGGYLMLWLFVLGMDKVVRDAQHSKGPVALFPPVEEHTENSQHLDP